jgi:hypothetical protein
VSCKKRLAKKKLIGCAGALGSAWISLVGDELGRRGSKSYCNRQNELEKSLKETKGRVCKLIILA